MGICVMDIGAVSVAVTTAPPIAREEDAGPDERIMDKIEIECQKIIFDLDENTSSS